MADVMDMLVSIMYLVYLFVCLPSPILFSNDEYTLMIRLRPGGRALSQLVYLLREFVLNHSMIYTYHTICNDIMTLLFLFEWCMNAI